LPQPFQKPAAHIKLPGMLFLPGRVKKQNRRALHMPEKKAPLFLNFSKQRFLFTGKQAIIFRASVSDGLPPGCFKEHLSGDS
jgi:hypothetical protein